MGFFGSGHRGRCGGLFGCGAVLDHNKVVVVLLFLEGGEDSFLFVLAVSDHGAEGFAGHTAGDDGLVEVGGAG